MFLYKLKIFFTQYYRRFVFILSIIYLLIITPNCFSYNWSLLWKQVPDEYPWSALIYSGTTGKQSIADILGGQYQSAHETVYATELAYTVYKTFWSKLQLAGNIAVRDADKDSYPDAHMVEEFNPYLMFRVTEFPWNNFISTTIGVGEGISFATRTPYPEAAGVTADNSQAVLDYMAFEVTFAMPSNPNLQFVTRIHHRSGAYGVFRPLNDHAGSNNIGIGIRYDF